MGKINFTNLNPSPELSYIIGAVLGDGHIGIYKRCHEVYFVNTDIDLLNNYNNYVEKIVGRKYSIILNRKLPNRKPLYRIRFGSKNLYYLIKGGIKNFKFIIEMYPADFVRGFADSEGCVTHVNYKAKEGIHHYPRIQITNKNLKLLKYIKNLIKNVFGIISFIRHRHTRNIDDLLITRKESIMKFKDNIGFYSIPKQNKLEVFCNSWTR